MTPYACLFMVLTLMAIMWLIGSVICENRRMAILAAIVTVVFAVACAVITDLIDGRLFA